MFCKQGNVFCFIISILSAIVAAVGIAAVFFAGLITNILILVYITLIVGAVALLVLAFSFICSKKDICNCIEKGCLIPTSIASIIVSAFALAATSLPTATIAVAILIGAVAFFLVLNLINIARTILCELCERCCR